MANMFWQHIKFYYPIHNPVYSVNSHSIIYAHDIYLGHTQPMCRGCRYHEFNLDNNTRHTNSECSTKNGWAWSHSEFEYSNRL